MLKFAIHKQPLVGGMGLVRNSLLILAGILATLAALEFGIRSYDAVRGFGFFSERRNPLAKAPKLRPFRTFGRDLYRERDGERFISSRHGELFPLEKPDGTYRIVAFGGSTTENLTAFKAAGIHYPAVLQKRLRQALEQPRIEVINVANAGYATPHALIVLALDAVSWDPDLIIVSHNINDLLAAYWPHFEPSYANAYKQEIYAMPDWEYRYTPANILFRDSQLYWVVRDRLARLWPKPPRNIRRRPYGKLPPSDALDAFKRNLRSIIAIAKQNGIKVLFGAQPLLQSETVFHGRMDNKRYNHVITYPLHDEFVAHHNHYNDAILAVARESGVYAVDHRDSISDNAAYFVDFVHYTPAGVEQLARNYARFLLDNRSLFFEKLEQGTR